MKKYLGVRVGRFCEIGNYFDSIPKCIKPNFSKTWGKRASYKFLRQATGEEYILYNI